MDTRSKGNFDELPSVETPEDVAVLYSWANLHGAKYRDFSRSRREYRAQLRHRAAEQAREVELTAQADTEAAAPTAGRDFKDPKRMRSDDRQVQSGGARSQSGREPEEAAERAGSERLEAARPQARAIDEANASARRQAALDAETETRSRQSSRREEEELDVPGKISDPYTPEFRGATEQANVQKSETSLPAITSHPARFRSEPRTPEWPQPPLLDERGESAEHIPGRALRASSDSVKQGGTSRRPQGYRPDDASGVRQIYRPVGNSNFEIQTQQSIAPPETRGGVRTASSPQTLRQATIPRIEASDEDSGIQEEQPMGRPQRQPVQDASDPVWVPQALASPRRQRADDQAERVVPLPAGARMPIAAAQQVVVARQLDDPTPKRRREDLSASQPTDSDRAIAAYRREESQPLTYAHAPIQRASQTPRRTPPAEKLRERLQTAQEPTMPAWITAQRAETTNSPSHAAGNGVGAHPEAQEPVVDTLQRSRERAASRWYALKGVFEQAGAERREMQPVRQKETRTPVLAVFSLAGGVGKTSLVATLGRSLSSLGEKVLLTDTTSHGLLPFYFGASELREGTVRTFSPPSGSTDAPIYLVNYGVDRNRGDEASQEALIEEIASSGRGTQRILLDLTAHTGWIVGRMAAMNPTVLIPVAPDMNSVISLQAIEKFFHGLIGADGAPLKFSYVLNQFDAALPLHLDVREVLRRQLGERLLPFVIRRAPAVSEALAEGMTIIDYSPDEPVAEDYMNVAVWLRAQSAPATAGFRNVRWSER